MSDMLKHEDMDVLTKLEHLQLIEHWNNPLYVLMPDKDNFWVEGNVEVFLTAESLHERITVIPKEQHMAYSRIPVIAAVDMVCQSNGKGLWIHGFPEGDVYVTREELAPLKELARGIIELQVVQATMQTQGTLPKFFEDKKMYLLGQLPTILNKTDDFYYFDTLRIPGRTYEMVKLYLTKEQAEKYNARNFEIHSYTFGELANYFNQHFGLIIEPQESYATVFEPVGM